LHEDFHTERDSSLGKSVRNAKIYISDFDVVDV